MKPPVHAGIYLIAQQQTIGKTTKYAVKVGRGKSISGRLDDYVTYTPFLEHLDYKTSSVSKSYELETHYRTILSHLGEKIENGSKEWYYVSKTIYNQLRKDGFKYLDKRGNEMNKQVFTLNAQQMYNNTTILHDIIQKLTDDPYWRNNDELGLGGGKSNASNRLIAPVKRVKNQSQYPVLKEVFDAHVEHGAWAMTGEQWAWYLNRYRTFLNKFNPTPFEIKLEGKITLTDLLPQVEIVKEESVKAEDPIIAPKMESKLEMKIMDYSYQADNVEQTLRNIQQLNQWLATYPDALKTMLIKI